MNLQTLAQVLDAKRFGSDVTFYAVVSDSRALAGGELFVALRGPRFDGHAFVDEAAAGGAVAALVDHPLATDLPHVAVADTRIALGRLAAYWRRQFDVPLVAVTGSNGKTTVKEMLGAILAERGPGLVTRGNLNNDIGVPLTLLGLRAEHRHAVIEMGMNHAGEIRYLSRMAGPDVALVTNAAEAHLEGVGGVEAVARAKGEIFEGLVDAGVAVINVDDTFCDLWRELAGDRTVVTFGLDQPADFSADYDCAATNSALFLKTPAGGMHMTLPIPGKHNVANAVAAGAAAMQAGASLDDIKRGLEKLRAMAGRLEIKHGARGARILDDTYNANPASVAAGLEVLRQSGGETVLVLGDMLELGAAAAAIHRRTGELARRVGVDRLYTIGRLARQAADGFGTGARHFRGHNELVSALTGELHGEMTVLVKGSRGSRMERIVQVLCATGEDG